MLTPFSLIFATIALSLFTCLLLISFLRGSPRRRLPPGPKPWPLVGNLPLLGPMPHLSIAQLARKHGPLMYLRLGSVDVVTVTSASMAEHFLKTHDANFSYRPPNSGAKYLAYDNQDMVFGPYGPRWRLLRKITNVHLFSGKALDDFRHVRQEEVGYLIGSLAHAGPEPVNLAQHLNVCNMNAIGRLVLGRRLSGEGNGEIVRRAEEFKSMLEELKVLTGIFNVGDFIPALLWLDLQGMLARMKKLGERLDGFFTEILKARKREIAGKTQEGIDMLSVMCYLQHNPDEEGMKPTDVEIKAVMLNMFVAGIDTTSSVAEWAVAELIRHPKIVARLQDELDLVIGQDRLVVESDLPNLTYLQAVTKETFRLHPPTPLSLPRMAIESCEIDGYHIPKGTTLLMNLWAIGRDPGVWAKPSVYRPERFLPGGEQMPNIDIKGNDFEVMPFGAGRRICPGMSTGLRMVHLLIATLIHAFNWELSDGVSPQDMNMDEAPGVISQRAQPLVVHPKPRLASHVYKASS